MKEKMVLQAIVAVLFLTVGSVSGYFLVRDAVRRQSADAARIIRIGDPAPDFSTKDDAGRRISLSDHRGKSVFLHFWATWCQPCAEEAPVIDALRKTLPERNFQFVMISLDTQWSAVKEFKQQHNVGFPVYLDPGRKVADLYSVYALPVTFLIDGNGVIVKRILGPNDWSSFQEGRLFTHE